MLMTFYDFVITFIEDDTPLGTLAHNVRSDKNFPKNYVMLNDMFHFWENSYRCAHYALKCQVVYHLDKNFPKNETCHSTLRKYFHSHYLDHEMLESANRALSLYRVNYK